MPAVAVTSRFLQRLFVASTLSTAKCRRRGIATFAVSCNVGRLRFVGLGPTCCGRPATDCSGTAGLDAVRRGYVTGSSAAAAAGMQDYIFRQLFDMKSWTCSYILADTKSREAVIIDPVLEQADRDITLVKDLNLNLIYGINTHVHVDHTTGTGIIRQHIPGFKSIIGKSAPARADRHVTDGELIKFGKFELECRSTPGHTNGCMTYVWHEKAMTFTGDTLLIRKCGRTDFLDGSAEKMYKSVHDRIFTLPGHYLICPGHDYTGQMISSVDEEKNFNIRFKKPLPQFIQYMKGLDEFPNPRTNVIYEDTLAANIVDGEMEFY